MFKDDYKAVFSKVNASEETYRRVMHMTKRSRKKTASGRRVAVLIAAVIALTAMTVTAFASETISGWFAKYFSGKGGAELSDSQVQFIEENEQTINETQTQQDWTVELRSVMTDGETGYIILGVTAPADVSLAPVIVDDAETEWFLLKGKNDDIEILSCSEKMVSIEGNYDASAGVSWKEDGDGLDNTKNVVLELTISELGMGTEPNIPDFFGSGTEWYIHIDSIVRKYENEEYRQELLNGKYKGQTDIMFTSEETRQLFAEEILAEGPWDFTFRFTDSEGGVELLTGPVTTKANVWVKTGTGIADYESTIDDVTMTSFVLNSLSATITYEYDGGVNFTDFKEWRVFAIMKDGSQIELEDYGGSPNRAVLKAKTPIVLEEVDYILMADGTKIPMPE